MSLLKVLLYFFMQLVLMVLPDFGTRHGGNVTVKYSKSSQEFVKEQFTGNWIHSQEEDYDDFRIYRLSGYEFPPARGREKMNLKSGGILEYTPIAPNDLPVTFNGKWSIEQSVLSLEYGNNKRKTYRIAGRDGTVLKLQRNE